MSKDKNPPAQPARRKAMAVGCPNQEELLAEFPDLTAEDIRACLAFAADRERNPSGMKLLFDQNLSPRLPRILANIYPKSVHVREIGMRDATDTVIWNTQRPKIL